MDIEVVVRELKKDIWPHKVTIKNESRFGEHKVVEQAEIWLGKTMGIYKGRWNYIYRYNGVDFYFKDGKDAVFFTLRWL